MGEIEASVEWAEMAPEMAHPLPRLGFEMVRPDDGDRLSMKSPGRSMGLRNCHFPLANRGRGPLKLLAN